MKLISRLAWLSFGAMVAIYVVMLTVTLPRIAAEAAGLMPFDMRPLGYSFDEAKAFLTALTPAGKDIYLTIQHRLDIAYPALLALTLALATVILAPRSWRRVRWVVALLPFAGMVFDYLENRAVAAMLAVQPDLIQPELVEAASNWTLLKSGLTTVAMVLVLLLLIGWFYRRLAGHGY